VIIAKLRNRARSADIKSVQDAVQKWLDACKYVGRHGKDPVSPATYINYEYRADIIKTYDWTKNIHEIEGPDVVEFREWLLKNYSRDVAKKVLSSFHSVVLEMNTQGVMTTDPAIGIAIQKSRYDEPVSIPSIEEMQAILRTADTLANHKNFGDYLVDKRCTKCSMADKENLSCPPIFNPPHSQTKPQPAKR
jgi:integrase